VLQRRRRDLRARTERDAPVNTAPARRGGRFESNRQVLHCFQALQLHVELACGDFGCRQSTAEQGYRDGPCSGPTMRSRPTRCASSRTRRGNSRTFCAAMLTRVVRRDWLRCDATGWPVSGKLEDRCDGLLLADQRPKGCQPQRLQSVFTRRCDVSRLAATPRWRSLTRRRSTGATGHKWT
jgi:hypothetical protein